MDTSDLSEVLPIVRLADKDGPAANWGDFKTPEELLSYIVKFFGVDPQALNAVQRFFIGDTAPDQNSIWIYASEDLPSFVGIPVGGSFVKFYQYPANSPFVLVAQENLPIGVRQLTTEEVENYGLNTLNAPAFWAILEIE